MTAMDRAMNLRNGARFYRCALQLNPYEYLVRHGKQTGFPDEQTYNTAIVDALLAEGIEVIAVTDHYRASTSEGLRQAAEAAGIRTLPGFEAVTKDGVHLLCLFSPERDAGFLERVLGDCGVHENDTASPVGKYDVQEFLGNVKTWGAVCMAAHVAATGGLLTKLTGTSAIEAWRTPELLACSLPGSISDAPANLKPILENKNPDYHRDRPVSVINAQDISSPEDVVKPGSSCWIRMSDISMEGLRQAFLDPPIADQTGKRCCS